MCDSENVCRCGVMACVSRICAGKYALQLALFLDKQGPSRVTDAHQMFRRAVVQASGDADVWLQFALFSAHRLGDLDQVRRRRCHSPLLQCVVVQSTRGSHVMSCRFLS